jgi:hypothetical protein
MVLKNQLLTHRALIEETAEKYNYQMKGDLEKDYHKLFQIVCSHYNINYKSNLNLDVNIHPKMKRIMKRTFFILYNTLNKEGYTTIPVKDIAFLVKRDERTIKRHLDFLHENNFITRCEAMLKKDEKGTIVQRIRKIYIEKEPPAYEVIQSREKNKERHGKKNIGKIRKSQKVEDLKKRERAHRAPSPSNPPKNLDFLNLSFKRIIPLIKEFNKPINEHEKRLKYFEFFKSNKMDCLNLIYFLPLPVIEQTFHSCKNVLSRKENPGGYLMTVLKIKYADYQKKLMDSKKIQDMKNDPIYKTLISELSPYLSIKKIEAKYHEIKEKGLSYKKVIQGVIQEYYKKQEDRKRLEAESEDQRQIIDFINHVLIPSVKEKVPHIHENSIKTKSAPLYDLSIEEIKSSGDVIIQEIIDRLSNVNRDYRYLKN